jgi:cyclohexadieny/prephenate dehydrogenase
MFEQITILGPGLLGGSLLWAARERGLAKRLCAWSRRPETRVKCAEQPWCDQVFADPAEAVATADLVVACTPVETIAPLLADVASHLKPGTTVTDVGSTKSLICRRARAVMPEGVNFIGSHPMAGSEKTGLEHAKANLFEGRTCFVTPLQGDPADRVEKLVRFWRTLGAEPVTETPEDHDEIVANISHLPHLLASALCVYLKKQHTTWQHYAGNGLRDTTRIAAGDPALWKSIVQENQEEIMRSLDGYIHQLEDLRTDLRNGAFPAIQNFLKQGKRFRDAL